MNTQRNWHRFLSYSLLSGGALASLGAVFTRQRWELANVRVGIVLDWDDLFAAATRARQAETPAHLLAHLLEHGATHLAIPELTLQRLLDRGRVWVAGGGDSQRVALQTQTADLARWLVAELQARLPHSQAALDRSDGRCLSFRGDLPAVTEIGLGFDPQAVDLARQAGLAVVARPIGYSWVQPEMIERTLEQAAGLGIKIVAVQGTMTPGFEYNLQQMIDAMQRHELTYAYFRESRHQRGDWYVAKSLAPQGRVLLAHELQPDDLLEEDASTVSRRWTNLAREGGVRLCFIRFFRVIHAGDPLEALDYIAILSQNLRRAGFLLSQAPEADLRPFLPQRDDAALALAGSSVAGAAGLAAEGLPLPQALKLAGLTMGAAVLTGLPFLETARTRQAGTAHHGHGHDHDHDHGHHHHHHDHHHHGHDHDHGHSHPYDPQTAYASKGLALAAAILYPLAAAAGRESGPIAALARVALVNAAGALGVSAILNEADYLLGVEDIRGNALDWLVPLGGAALTAFGQAGGRSRWLPLAGLLWPLLQSRRNPGGDSLARLDREHRHAHTHHISAFRQLTGDAGMAFSARPLRKWSLLAPLGAAAAAVFRRRQQPAVAAGATMVAAAGSLATLTGFRNPQRSLGMTALGRSRAWLVGLLLAPLVWLGLRFFVDRGQ